MTDPLATQPAQPAQTALPAPQTDLLSGLFQTQIPWLLVGAVAVAAWWWEETEGKKQKRAELRGAEEDEEEDDEEDDAEEADEVGWTDERIRRPSRRKHSADLGDMADLRGPISDTYIQPIKLAAEGHCDEAVALLDKQTRQGAATAGRKSPIVRRALRRSAEIVTERCPKQVSQLVGEHEASLLEAEEEVGFKPSHDVLLDPAKSKSIRRRPEKQAPHILTDELHYDPETGTVVPRERGEASRFTVRTKTGKKYEYRRKGASKYRVTDTETGETRERSIPSGRPAGRPKKLK